MKPLLLRLEAAADIEDAYLWYESQRSGLGERFLEEVSATIHQITEGPELSAIVYRETRRALVRRFPYCVFFRVLDRHIVVVACLHAHRNPARWQDRE